MRSKDKGNGQAQERGPSFDTPKRNLFYVIYSRGEQEESPYAVTSMLQVFLIDDYALLEPRATSFLTPLLAIKFDVLPDILIEPFSVTTPVVTSLWLEESLGVVLQLWPIELHG